MSKVVKKESQELQTKIQIFNNSQRSYASLNLILAQKSMCHSNDISPEGTRMRIQSKTCAFVNIHNELLKDKIVCIWDYNKQSVHEKLLTENKLTLEQVASIICMEQVNKHPKMEVASMSKIQLIKTQK